MIISKFDPNVAIQEIEDVRQNGKDLTLIKHVQYTDPIKKQVYELKKEDNNGFGKSREYQHVARIPTIEFIKHPEWMHDPNLIDKWLYTDEGRPYRIARNL